MIFLGQVHGCGQPCPETPTSFLGVRTLRVLVISNIAFLIEEKSFEKLHSTPIFGVYSPSPLQDPSSLCVTFGQIIDESTVYLKDVSIDIFQPNDWSKSQK